tara:strand:- start:370 stop:783 length:414 start_codon:yes stop_codon:yes gene_type:complete
MTYKKLNKHGIYSFVSIIMEKNIKKGSSLNIMQVNVRGHVIPIHTSNPILAHSNRIQDSMKNKIESNFPIYLDVNPNIFHSLLSYFKQEQDNNKNKHRINNHIHALFKRQFTNNPEVLATMVYLEMSDVFILQFIEY